MKQKRGKNTKRRKQTRRKQTRRKQTRHKRYHKKTTLELYKEMILFYKKH